MPALVWSSPLPRARQTCDITLDVMGCGLPVHNDIRLAEMCKGLKDLPGGMEGRLRELVETPEYWEQYRRGGWDFRHGSKESKGETAREVGVRVLAAMNEVADGLEEDATAFVFTHGQAARFGLGGALDWPDIRHINREYKMDNCEGLIMSRNPKKRWEFVGRLTLA